MSKQEIKDQLISFLTEEGGITENGVLQSDTKLIESGLFDSIVIVSLFAFCEEKFNLELDLTTIDESIFESVNSMTDYIVSVSSS